MSVRFFSEDVDIPNFRRRSISNWLKFVISSQNKKIGSICFIFCSDNYLLEINNRYLSHDYFTDIITFDYVENNLVSGDIFISLDRVLENSLSYNVSYNNELFRILVHGILHLLGFNDKLNDEKALMTEKEDFYLKVLNDNFLV